MLDWFVRNAAALAVAVVAGGALVGVLLGLPLYENAQFQSEPVEVAMDESIDVNGYSWTLVASGEFPHSADNEEVPEGLATIGALIEVRPLDDAATTGTCGAELVNGEGLEARRWMTLSSPSSFNYGLLEESTTVCLLEGESFDYEVVFLAPEGTMDEAAVELEIGGMGGELVRFALTD